MLASSCCIYGDPYRRISWISPTSEKVKGTTGQIYRMIDDKFVERTLLSDVLGVFKQLGVIEHTEKAKQLISENAM